MKRHYGKRKRTHKEHVTYAELIRRYNFEQAILLYRLESELAAIRAEMMVEGYPLGNFKRRAGLLWKPTIRAVTE